MDEYESLSHSKWECKYHVVFIPKCRRKALYEQLRKYLGEVFRRLAEQKESRVEEGHLLSDHVHMLISIPPKYAVAQVIGFMKGGSGSVPKHTRNPAHCCPRLKLTLIGFHPRLRLLGSTKFWVRLGSTTVVALSPEAEFIKAGIAALQDPMA